MMRLLSASPKSLLVIFVLMFALVLASSKLLTGIRADLTENGLYTLSDGTRKILSELENPVTLTLYFSEKGSNQLPALRTYAQRVEELLEEYETLAKGKIVFAKIDPEPFSEAEDAAALAGLTGVPVGASGEEIYFGLVAQNDADAQEVVPFMQPDREGFLEYELTRLIVSLSQTNRPKLGIYSGIDIKAGFDFMTRQQKPAWTILELLEDNFELVWISDEDTEITDVSALLLVAPQTTMPDGLKFAVDQYVMSGGKTMIFLDPYAESALSQTSMPTIERSDLAELLPKWGIKLRDDMFVTDYANSMVVGIGAQRTPVRHIGLLGLTPESLDYSDIALHGLESLNWSSAGILDLVSGAETVVTPLIQTSEQSQARETSLLLTLTDPKTLLDAFEPSGERFMLAARVTGKASTVYPDGLEISIEKPLENTDSGESDDASEDTSEPKMETIKEQLTPKYLKTDNLQLLVVADTDILTDRLWVQVQQFFGQRVVSPWADNGTFVANALEHLSGNSDLLSIRSQGRFNRPFDRVEALRRDAEAHFLEQQELLQQELSGTEEKLVELEKARKEGDGALFSPEQQTELAKFQQEKLKIRKQLRDVQHQLDQDIDALGTNLKIINIFLIPVIICILVLFGALRKRVA